MLNEKKFKRRVEELSRRRYPEMRSVAPFEAVPERRDSDQVYAALPSFEGSRPMGLEEEFTGCDCYLWLRGTLPFPRPGYPGHRPPL